MDGEQSSLSPAPENDAEEVSLLALVAVHVLVALALPVIAHRSTRIAFVLAALPPVAGLVWLLASTGFVLDGQEHIEVVPWAPQISLELTFRLDPLAFLLGLLVTGVGAAVLIYSISYFQQGSAAAKRSGALLLLFAGVMLGLVLSDDLITLYVFWELTTICSFLLVGQAGISRESRRSALQALMITIFGGLLMLLGFVVLGEMAGTYRISELVASPPEGAWMPVAALLILMGAFTKSAQMPFHNWLPAAMVAPTPISAYLHAASMVKAGVFLVARLAPVFLDVPEWRVSAVALGVITMVIGGWRALREYDLKRLLAYGTVSQLGFLMVLFSAGTSVSAMAGATLLLAHGLFKATLFLVVGIVDHNTGTRDIRELSGIARRMPWLAVVAVLAVASMAGIPPTLGFVAKEAAFEAFAHANVLDLVVLAGLVIGSVFTVGYSFRFLWGTFGNKAGVPATSAKPLDAVLFIPTAIPSVTGFALGIGYPFADQAAAEYADEIGDTSYHLGLWHGFGAPLVCTLIALVGGSVLQHYRAGVSKARDELPAGPDAQHGYERIMATLERVAVAVTGRIQAGSLPTYVGIILVTVIVVPGGALLQAAHVPRDLRLYDNLLQIPLAICVLAAAFGVLRAQRRLTAVLMVGVIGYGIGGLFVVDGAPDLALAQFLVETLTLIAFVFVLRRLPARFTQGDVSWNLRWPKALVAGTCGVFMAVAALIFSEIRRAPPVASHEFIARAEEGAGATNVVNAILVDFRAFDTVGEISVLAVAATGVASLVLASRFDRRKRSGSSRLQPNGEPVPVSALNGGSSASASEAEMTESAQTGESPAAQRSSSEENTSAKPPPAEPDSSEGPSSEQEAQE